MVYNGNIVDYNTDDNTLSDENEELNLGMLPQFFPI
jgi:hypothetical protein